MSFTLTILGSSSAAPTSERNSSSQVLNTDHHVFLLDCAEGTQIQLRKNKIRLMKIDHVMITHLHGDHFFGLIGLLTTWHLLGRSKPIHIYSTPEIKPAIDLLLETTQATLIYPVIYHFHQTDHSEIIFEDKYITVSTIPLLHRIPTVGFLFQEKTKKRKINKAAISGKNLPFWVYDQLQNGEDVSLPDGEILTNQAFTTAPSSPLSYAYCTDTEFFEELANKVAHVDLLFHESTFCESESVMATEKQHSTARQAATIAKMADVGVLLLGHFSSRYKVLTPLLTEAKEVFDNVLLAEDGMIIKIDES